ncbi:MAG: HAD-IC family P-type ATPase, partial [Thermoflexales bacterium]|nr:HAD-IC family P-type ATPase [Thermoflexales bacterium]
TDIVPLGGATAEEALAFAAAIERDSEHPVAEALRKAAAARGLALMAPEGFVSIPGQGVEARVGGVAGAVGNAALLPAMAAHPAVVALAAAGKTVLSVSRAGQPYAVLGVADTLREDVGAALAELRASGPKRLLLLTGDSPQAAAPIATALGLECRASLLPEDKIEVVQALQREGRVVAMIGDGVNDAPALAQADVGIALAVKGAPIAVEAAPIALLADDWGLVVAVWRIAKRTMSIVRTNLVLTAIYNIAGVSLAALGVLPPAIAAAAQTLPDVGILLNSARLLRE